VADSYQDELDAIMNADAQRQATNYYQSTATVQVSDAIKQLSDDFWWLPPGTMYALANDGITGESALEIAQMELQRQISEQQNKFDRRVRNRKKKQKDDGQQNGVGHHWKSDAPKTIEP